MITITKNVLLDMAKKNGIEKIATLDFSKYYRFLLALHKSYSLCKAYDSSGTVEANVNNLFNNLAMLLDYISNNSEHIQSSLQGNLFDDYTRYKIITKIPEFMVNNLKSMNDNEYLIFRGLVNELTLSTKAACSSIKQLYAEKIITVNSKDQDGALVGNVLLRSVSSLKKSYLEPGYDVFTVSTRITNTKDPHWYWEQNRSVALLYDFDWRSLIVMGINDLGTDNGHKVDWEHTVGLDEVENKLFMEYQLDSSVGIQYGGVGAYPAIPIELLSDANELIFTMKNQPVGIVVSKDYDLEDKDYAGVKTYSDYAEIPIYRVSVDKFIKII